MPDSHLTVDVSSVLHLGHAAMRDLVAALPVAAYGLMLVADLISGVAPAGLALIACIVMGVPIALASVRLAALSGVTAPTHAGAHPMARSDEAS